MLLADNALITPERITAFFDNQESPNDLIPLINAASEAIEAYCNRPFIEGPVTRIFDSNNETIIRLPSSPLVSVTSVRFDQLRVFDDTTEITDFTVVRQRSEIHLARPRGYFESVFQVATIEGYVRPKYVQLEEPDDQEIGDVWVSPTAMTRWTHDEDLATDSWELVDGYRMPATIEACCAEYVSFLKIRFRTGGAGLVSQKRGYAFEGSEIAYEKRMPQHITDRLAPFVRFS
jgi:hypothetical protein